MQFRIKFWVFMLITVLMFVCCFNEKVLYSKTKAYKNQSLNGKHVGAYVPTYEYQIPDSFDIPNGKSFSNIFKCFFLIVELAIIQDLQIQILEILGLTELMLNIQENFRHKVRGLLLTL